MKEKLISTLKKDLLILELAKHEVINIIFEEGIYVIDKDTNNTNLIKGSYTILGRPNEIKEEDVKEFVDKVGLNYSKRWYAYENYIISGEHFSSALESFHSALESEIYWNVNPLEEPNIGSCDCSDCQDYFNDKQNEWNEAQEKTFDKKRTLIFVKN